MGDMTSEQGSVARHSVEEEALHALSLLEDEDQLKVLDYIRTLVEFAQGGGSQPVKDDVKNTQEGKIVTKAKL